jgi:hypothetical protein
LRPTPTSGSRSPCEEHYAVGDVLPGSPVPFTEDNVNLRIDISAELEPDADGDGYGDETQDLCPSISSIHGDCTAPETRITKNPKRRTSHRQAVLEFRSSEPGATFECAVGGSRFSGCTSPKIFKRGIGRHVFQVRSTDILGNVDATPDIARWKVVRKPHHH